MFKLNGQNCIEPGFLKNSLGEAGFILWWKKYSANCFTLQCGVDSGRGYLLLETSKVPTNQFSVPLVIGNVTIPKVCVVKSVEIEAPAGTSTANTPRLVEVADIRHYLKKTYVKKNYNVIRFINSTEGNAEFDTTTMKEAGEDSYVPWTWETMLQDLWSTSLLSSETLNLDDAEFPELLPNNYRFKASNWTHRDALGQILTDLGFTLEPQTNGSWRVVQVNSDSQYLAAVNNLSSKLIQSNNIDSGNGEGIPAKLLLSFPFPEESPASKENSIYVYEHTVSPSFGYQSVLSGSSEAILCNPQAHFDYTDPTNPINKVDLDLFASTIANRLIRLLYTDDGYDKTFSGLLTGYASADIGRVTWKDTGSNINSDGTGPTTRLEHCFPVPKLPKIVRPSVPIQKVSGNPASDVTPLMPTFQLINLKLINGVKPEEPLTVQNTYAQTLSTANRVESEYCYEDRVWNTSKLGGDGTPLPGRSLERFQLVSNKERGDLTANAFVINPNNFALLYPIVLVDTPTSRYTGFGPRSDPQFGNQGGYRGWSQYGYTGFSSELGFVVEHHYPITMEAPARWIDGVTFEQISSADSQFMGRVFNYWGAYPNNRAPATYLTEGTDGDEVPVIDVYDEHDLITETFEAGAKFSAVYDEERNIYILVSITANDVPKGEMFGLLIRDIPACTYTLEECTHGFAEQAVRIFTKQREDPDNDESPHKFKYAGEIYDVINPIYPTEIKAGETTNEAKPVVVVGYLDKWQLGDGEELRTVFILRNVIYPISIIRGTSAGAVSGSGDITVNGIELLWGRPPGVNSLQVANPEGWEGPSPSVVIAVQITNGSWLALYVTCPPAE